VEGQKVQASDGSAPPNAETDEHGFYYFPKLAPGEYEVCLVGELDAALLERLQSELGSLLGGDLVFSDADGSFIIPGSCTPATVVGGHITEVHFDLSLLLP